MNYDVIIVGAGPAGIFSALELAEKTKLNVLMLDRGQDINQRKCPASRGYECVNCDPCSVLSGWGGAGAFSDGKLTLSTEVGGWLDQYMFISFALGVLMYLLLKNRFKDGLFPFGTALALSGIVSLFFGQSIIDWYMNFLIH